MVVISVTRILVVLMGHKVTILVIITKNMH